MEPTQAVLALPWAVCPWLPQAAALCWAVVKEEAKKGPHKKAVVILHTNRKLHICVVFSVVGRRGNK